MANEITTAIEFLKKIREEDICTISFIKRSDKSTRVMKFTLNFNRIPVEDRPKGVNLEKILKMIYDHRILTVYDLEKKGWRSIPFDAVEWLKVKGVTYSINLEGK